MSRIGTILGIVFALAYNNWLLWPLNGDPRLFIGFLSELDVSSQPYHGVFQGGDVLSGVALLALVGWAWRRWPGQLAPRRVSAAVGVLLVLFALGVIADTSLPMACSPTLDPGCPTYTDVRQWPPEQWVHASLSTGTELALLTTMALVALRGEQAWRRRALVVLLITLVTHVTMLALSVTIAGEGIPQTVLMITQGVWGVLLGRASVSPPGGRPPGTRPAPRPR